MNTDYPPAQGKGAIEAAPTDGDKDVERWQRTAEAAFFRAQARGFAPGHELDDWLAAERELAVAPVDEPAAEIPATTAPALDAAAASKDTSAGTPQADAAARSAPTKRAARNRKTKPGSEPRLGGMA